MDLYTEDRIEPSILAHSDVLDKLLKQTEELFAKHFSEGDIQAARRDLLMGIRIDTYYDTTYRAGFMCGLALPAAVMAIVKCESSGRHS
jgi:hypothetical protein